MFHKRQTLSLTVSQEHRFRTFESKELRRIFGPKREKKQEGGENGIMRSFVNCTLHQILLE
jgi:hypothetical protein